MLVNAHVFYDYNHSIHLVFDANCRDINVLMLGNYPLYFENDDIIINCVKYEGTSGLYEFIFMKQPGKKVIWKRIYKSKDKFE